MQKQTKSFVFDRTVCGSYKFKTKKDSAFSSVSIDTHAFSFGKFNFKHGDKVKIILEKV